MVFGYNSESAERNKFWNDLVFACYDEYEGSKLSYYKKFLQIKFIYDKYLDDGESNEIFAPIELTPVSVSINPLDSPWPMKCHDTRHTGRSPYNTVNNMGIEKWRFKTDDWIAGGSVIGDDGTIYFGCFDHCLYALYPNGTLKWKHECGGGWIWSSPAIDENGTIYIGSDTNYLFAINPNGTRKWSFNAHDAIYSSPAIAEDGTIYFGTMGSGYNIYAVNPNGTEKWHYSAGYRVTSDPAIGDDGTVFIGSMDDYLYALYPNGTLRWRFKTGHYVKGPPSIAKDGTIYVGSWDDYLYALYPNGTMKWKCKVGYGTETNPSIADDGTIYVGGDKLYAVYPNGTMRWSFGLGSDRHIHQSSPAISADGTIYVGTNIGDAAGGELIAVNPDGTERWRSNKIADEWVESSPSIAEDGTVYIGSAHLVAGNIFGYLHAFGKGEFEADAHGPYYGLVDESVQFIGSARNGSEPYSWEWDFGDSNVSYEQNATHTYANPGNYTVILTVTDSTDGPNSTVNDTTWALIRAQNSPPSDPIIDGPTEGKAGVEYDYTFISIDPDGDNISYLIEWGDGIEIVIGPYPSGEEAVASHSWQRGAYSIRAKAVDSFGAESNWSELEVTMPRGKTVYVLIERLLERFPLLEQLLLLLKLIK
jgi:outer membrane protein assembly factor BamB